MNASALLKKKVFARCAFASLGKSAIPRSQFMEVCTASSRVPSKHRMTVPEAELFLQSLERAGAALRLAGDQVHLRPVEVVDAVHLRAGLPTLGRSIPHLEANRKALVAAGHGDADKVEEKLAQVVAKQKTFWALTAVLSGAQMTVLAYLQFQVFGWDVMEPVTYFITTATALLAYVYFLCFHREHSYQSVDEILMPKILTRDMDMPKTKRMEWVATNEMRQELDQLSESLEDKAAALLALARKESKNAPSQSLH